MSDKVKIEFKVNGVTYNVDEIQEDVLKDITLREYVEMLNNSRGILK